VILGNFIFSASYTLYVFCLLRNNQGLSYPVYLAPFVVYALLCAASAGAKAVNGGTFKGHFKDFSLALSAFIILAAAPLIIKLNIPDPHNFIERKFELILGISYAMYIIYLTIIFIMKIWHAKGQEEKTLLDGSKFTLIFFFIFYFSVSLWFNYANQPTGDEPFYLLTAHSIVYDHDLDLKNNFDNRDYKKFYKDRELVPQIQDIKNGNAIFSFHPVIYSALIAPFYMAAGRLGVTAAMNLAAAMLIAMIFLMLNLDFSRKTAAETAYITGFSLPVFMFCNQAATELVSALFILSAYYMIRKKSNRIVLFSAVMAAIPWLHIRNSAIYGCLILIFIYYYRKEMKSIISFGAIQIFSLMTYILFNMKVYGTPFIKYAGGNQSFFENFNGANILSALAGILYDQEFGIFTYTPVFAIMFAGAYLLHKYNRKTFYELLIVFVPYFAMILAWVDWRGGGGASPRFLVPLIFVFSFLTAAVIDRIQDRTARITFWFMTLSGFFMSAFIFFIPWFRWNKGFGENWVFMFISRMTHVPFSKLFPSLWRPDSHTVFVLSIWIIITFLINYYLVLKSRKK
jgi:hypothetical protein